MNKNELINRYYTKESAVKILTSYILYYQISLGEYAHQTIQDPDETILKLKELNLTLDPNQILIEVLHIIFDKSVKHLDKKFEQNLKINAILHALKDFVENDDELLSKNMFIENKKKEILNDVFFNTRMKMQYLGEYEKMNKYYENLISDDYLENVKEILKNNFI